MIRFMNSIMPFLLLCLIILLFPRIIKGQFMCLGPTTYSPNSTYHTNLNRLLSSLSSNANQRDGYYHTTVGQDTDSTIYGAFLCRGDVTVPACQECVSSAIKDITSPQQCPNTTQAIGWYGDNKCMIRYSDTYFFSIAQDDPTRILHNFANATDPTRFMKLVVDTLSAVAQQAAYSGGSKKFATKEANFSDFETIYSRVQCTPDISAEVCLNCLRKITAEYRSCCIGKVGGVVLSPSCNIRYQVYPFQEPTPPPPETPSNVERKGHSTRTVVIVVISSVGGLLIFVFLAYYLLKSLIKTRRNVVLRQNYFGNETNNLEPLRFSLATIEAATNKFSHEKCLGQGGFGRVYKGVLSNGQEIAIKRLSKSSDQGAEEFKNEVLLIAKLQHRNLVALLGFCIEGREKVLIYEYVPNKSLDNFLFGSQRGRVLNWVERCNIIGGVARGILYLHEYSRLKVIHRDLKPSNILLDNEMNPKISDFGLAKLVAINTNEGSTNRIVGTYGYMSPEYAMYGQYSEKSYVFSFGVIVLEIISGKKNASRLGPSQYAEGLLSYAWKQWKEEKLVEILDSNIEEFGSYNEVIKCIQIGLLCVQENPDSRPTMTEVVSYLSNDSTQLPLPHEPAFSLHVGMESSTNSGSNNESGSTIQVSVSEFFPR